MLDDSPVPAIELVDATKRYGSVVAVDGISLRIDSGEFFCLLGPSGCGKTTTLNLIGGFIPLTAGTLRIEGRVVNDLPPHKRNVNTVFQSYALFPHMTVLQNVEFGLRMEGLSAAERLTRAEEYLDLVGLTGLAHRSPNELSGGQQQRVALARALAKRPAVLLLDEPLGALDLKLRHQMEVELSRIHRQVGTTFVFVTHDQEEALSMSTRIAVMSGGRVIQAGTPSEIYFRPADRFVADFIGDSNFLEGEVTTDGEERMFRLEDGTSIAIPPTSVTGPATLMIRPETIRIAGLHDAHVGGSLVGRVGHVAFMGNHTRVTVDTPAGPMVVQPPNPIVDSHAPKAVRYGEEVRIWWDPDLARILDSRNEKE